MTFTVNSVIYHLKRKKYSLGTNGACGSSQNEAESCDPGIASFLIGWLKRCSGRFDIHSDWSKIPLRFAWSHCPEKFLSHLLILNE